jgi:hypothetical protein
MVATCVVCMSTMKMKNDVINGLLIEYIKCAEQCSQRRVMRGMHKELCRVLGIELSFALHFH